MDGPILVTGATGTVGSAVVDQLVAARRGGACAGTWGAVAAARCFDGARLLIARSTAAAAGIAWKHLRPNVFMQNLISCHGASIRRTGSFSLAQGDACVSFIDVREGA